MRHPIGNFLLGTRDHASSTLPYMLSLRSSRLFIVSTICLAVFTDLFLYGVIVPVIPFAISERVGVPESDRQYWIAVLLAVYGGALFVASPVAGWYADHSSSRRLPLLLGLLALAGATLILCLARNIGLLVTGRVLQGISAAIVWTTGQALLVDTVGQRDIGRVMGYVSISMSLGILIAPLLGGVVYNRAGYLAVYYMSFALILVDIFMRLALIEKKIASQWLEPGQESISTLQEVKVTPPSNVPESHAVSPSDVTQHVVSPEMHEAAPAPEPGPAFIDPPARSSRLPPVITLLGSRRLLAALWGCLLQGAIATAFDSVIPIFVSQVFLWDSIGAGLTFLAIIVPTFAAPLVGMLSDRYGPRWLVVGGFLFGLPFLVLLRLVTENTTQHKVLFYALLTLIGAGLVLVMVPLMAEITYVVEAKEKKSPGLYGKTGAYAQAYGLFVTAYAGGSLIGPLWGGLIVEKADWGTMCLSLGLLMASGAVPSLIWTGGLITRDNAKTGDERAVERPDEKTGIGEPTIPV